MPGWQAREVDRRESHAVAGVRLGAAVGAALRRPARQRDQLADELVPAAERLHERGAVEEDRPEPPASLPVAARLAGLHLEDQDPALGMGDDEVRFAVLGRSAVPHRPGPRDIGIQAVLGRERLAQPLVDSPLGFLAVGHGMSVAGGRAAGYAATAAHPRPRVVVPG